MSNILLQALQAIGNVVNPGGQYKQMQSPIVERNDMQKDPALQYYYAHQPDNPTTQAAIQQTSAQSPTPTMQVIQQAKNTLSQTPQGAFSQFTTAKVPDTLSPLIYSSAQKAGVDPNVLASLLFSEHGFIADKNMTPNIDPKTGKVLSYDRGIAQINSVAHPEITDEQAFDPNFAIPWTAHSLAGHVNNMGDYTHGIAAYNVGEGGASLSGNTPSGLGPRGQAYVDKVGRGLSPQLQQKLGIKIDQ